MKNSTAFILLLVSVGLFYAFILPHYGTVQALSAQSDQYKNILANISALTQKRDDLLVKYQNTSPTEIDRLEKILPANVDTVSLAVSFDSIASKYGITIKSIHAVDSTTDTGGNIVQSTSASPYNKVAVSFSFVSTYANFRKFLADIENSLRIIDVKSVSFQTTDNGFYNFDVSVDTYWLKS